MDKLKSELSLLRKHLSNLKDQVSTVERAINTLTAKIQSQCGHSLLLVQVYWNYDRKLFSIKCSDCETLIHEGASAKEYHEIKDKMRNSVFFEI